MNEFFIKIKFLLHAIAELNSGFISQNHSHNFWQLEIFKEGKATGYAGKDIFHLATNDIFIIPSNVIHHFEYKSDSSIISLRFNVSGNNKCYSEAFQFPNNPLKDTIRFVLLGLSKNMQYMTEPEIIFIEYLLASIISICDLNMHAVERPHKAVTNAISFIEKNKNRYISITTVGREIGCSPGYLSALFKKHSEMSLKSYIDKTKSEFIKQHLLYSELTITDIATIAGFEDIYSFSRFFKRLTGLSPNQFRKKYVMG